LWHILSCILEKPGQGPIVVDEIGNYLDQFKPRDRVTWWKRIKRDISELNNALTAIKWPVLYSLLGGLLHRD
jgi:hypothetical protein